MSDINQQILTVKEACLYLKISPKTLRRWELKGLVKPFRSGEKAKKLFKKEELDKIFKVKKGK